MAEKTANSNGFAADDLKIMYGDSGSGQYFLELLNETKFPFEIQVADATLEIHAETQHDLYVKGGRVADELLVGYLDAEKAHKAEEGRQ